MEEKMELYEQILNVLDELLQDATSADEFSLPPHQEYIVSGDIIRKIAELYNSAIED